MSIKKLLIFGDSTFAEVAYECFTHDSDFVVVGFVVESNYLTKTELFGLPVVPIDHLDEFFPSKEIYFYVALVYSQMNRLRKRLYLTLKSLGYRPASYISSRSFVWHNVEIGEHCFIFEDNTLQPFVNIGDNVVCGVETILAITLVYENCFISSHVVVSGHCAIGSSSFLGVNSTIANNIELGSDNWVGPGVLITKSTDNESLFKVNPPAPSKVSTLRFFRVNN